MENAQLRLGMGNETLYPWEGSQEGARGTQLAPRYYEDSQDGDDF